MKQRPFMAHSRPRLHSQAGAALLAAMLTVTLVATLASAALWQQWRDLEVETAELNRLQASWLLLGALDWSRVILQEDARANRNQPIDHLGEPWAVPLQEARLSTFLAAQNNVSQADANVSDVQDAFLSGSIIDLQSRLNLRGLIGAASDAQSMQSFQRLFQRLSLPSSEVARLSQALTQASQSTTTVTTSAAPNNAVLMPRTVAQLVWLGFAPQLVARIEPFVTLLPEVTPVNINTASAEVLWASMTDLDWAQANQIVQLRMATPFNTVAAAAEALKLPSLASASNFTVFTRFFEARGRMRMGENMLSERSIIQRDGMSVKTIWRERGDWGMPAVSRP